MEQQRAQVETERHAFYDSFRQELADAAGKISQLEGERLKLLSAIGEGALNERQLVQENKELREKARAESAGHKAILEVLANVERMIEHLEKEYAGTWVHTGAARVYQSFCSALKKMNIEVIECADGTAFDPALHEAVATETGTRGTVIRIVRRGYRYLDGGIIQHVLVSVGDG